MKDAFIVNASLIDENIKEQLMGLIENNYIIFTDSISELLKCTEYYSLKEDVDTIYAVGDDSTANLIANVLINKNKKLGIVPIGKCNNIYKKIKDKSSINISYVNDYLFLNQIVIADTGFKLENLETLHQISGFEFVSNLDGKYKIRKSKAIVINNLLDSDEIEVILLNENGVFRKENIKYKTTSLHIDLLGNMPVKIDGYLYYLPRIDLKKDNRIINIDNSFTKRLKLNV